MKSMVLFSSMGGVGKTTLTFHIAHMMARNGLRVVVLDYDPQCTLSVLLLSEQVLFEIWEATGDADTVARCFDRVERGEGEVRAPTLMEIDDNLWLLPGDLALSRFEQPLAEEWSRALGDDDFALAATTAFDLLSKKAAEAVDADIVLLDVAPSLGALNRAALLACDAIVLPLQPDLFSLEGLKHVGPMLVGWRDDWAVVQQRCPRWRGEAALPRHPFQPMGYIVQQQFARSDRPARDYERWFSQIPAAFHEHVLRERGEPLGLGVDEDPCCIAKLKNFASLVPLAQLARKPLFDLKRADGIGGGQLQAVATCRKEFEALVEELLRRLRGEPGARCPPAPA